MLNDFPEKLARARKNAGFTQKEIERALNIKQSAIASYESGRSRPTYENLVKLADFYDVTCDWLLGAKRAAEAERLEREAPIYRGPAAGAFCVAKCAFPSYTDNIRFRGERIW